MNKRMTQPAPSPPALWPLTTDISSPRASEHMWPSCSGEAPPGGGSWGPVSSAHSELGAPECLYDGLRVWAPSRCLPPGFWGSLQSLPWGPPHGMAPAAQREDPGRGPELGCLALPSTHWVSGFAPLGLSFSSGIPGCAVFLLAWGLWGDR